MTIIKKCNCKSSFQDEMYGLFMRVMNINTKKGAKCTVCGSIYKVD